MDKSLKILLISSDEKEYARIHFIVTEKIKKCSLDRVTNYVQGMDAVKRGEHDIYFVDNDLKIVGGYDLLKKMKEAGNKKPTILLVNADDLPLGIRSIEEGASDYLIKDRMDTDTVFKSLRYSMILEEIEQHKQIKSEEGNSMLLLTLLTEASKILASSFDYHDTIQKTVRMVVDQIADWSLVEIVSEDGLKIISAEHIIPTNKVYILQLREYFPPNFKDSFGPGVVLRSKRPEHYFSIDEIKLKEIAKNTRQLSILKQLGMASYISVPIETRGRVFGVMTAASSIAGRYGEQEVALFTELAGRVAMAIENARLYKESKKSEEIFRRLVESNMMGLSIINFEGRVLAANDVVLNMLGYTKEEVINNNKFNWRNIYPEEYRLKAENTLRELQKSGMVSPQEREFFHKSGRRVPVLVGTVLLNEDNQSVLAFTVDITAQKELDQQKDEFISIASHELKTPLTSQKVYLELLEKSLSKGKIDKSKMLLPKISEQTERLIKLVNDLLDVSRITAGKMVIERQPIDLQRFVIGVVDNIKLVEKDYDIVVEGRVDKDVMIDENRIEQVITNLLANAIKYSPIKKRIIVNISEASGYAKVSVQDFGIGINEENQQKLFSRFVRVGGVEKTFPGFGLGLYISSEIVRRHGGEMQVKSKLGKGSTFSFTVPFSDS